jgi:hypothetical protein
LQDQDDHVVSIKRSDIRRLEAAAKAAQEAESRAAAAERKLAFASAGLPLEDKRLGYFIKGYEGDLTPEAIKAAAVDAGFLEDASAGSADDVTPAEQQAHQRMSQTASAGGPPPNVKVDDLAAASSPEEVMRMYREIGGRVVGIDITDEG